MNTRELFAISLDKIVVTQGRELNMEAVDAIASSIDLVGLLYPITVLAVEDGNFRLIAGQHRLAAMRLLGRNQIDAQIYRGLSDIEVRLAEIVENLQRAELTRLEKAEQTAEYVRLAKEKREQGGAQVGQHPSNVKGASGRERGDSAAARDLGLTRQEIQRAEQIDAIDPETKAKAIAEGLGNNQRALIKIAAAPKEQQQEVIKELSAKKPRKKRSTPRAANDVQAAVEAILRDFGTADVQLIIDRLSKGLVSAQSATEQPLENPGSLRVATEATAAAMNNMIQEGNPLLEQESLPEADGTLSSDCGQPEQRPAENPIECERPAETLEEVLPDVDWSELEKIAREEYESQPLTDWDRRDHETLVELPDNLMPEEALVEQ